MGWSLKEAGKWRKEHLPVSLTLPPEVLERGFSVTSKVVSLTVGEKGKIKHLQHFQTSVEDVAVSKHV